MRIVTLASTGTNVSYIIRARLGNALIKHQVLEMAGSEVTNKIANGRHLLLKLNKGEGALDFITLSFGTNLALDTALTAFVYF